MPIAVVLVRPLFAGNLGSVARVMKNMGLKDLRLVAPKADKTDLEARKMATPHAQDLLKKSKIFPNLKTALTGFDLVVGTSRRKGRERGNWTTPRQFAEQVGEMPKRQKIALVFGPEDSGLLNDDVALCQRMIHIPSHENCPSLNLAQAVMVLAYELFVAQGAKAEPKNSTVRKSVKLQVLEAMYEDLGTLLAEIGFLNRQNPKHLMRLLRQFFNRARPTEKEVRIFRGICRQARWWKQQA